jgi:hypothetical protein
MAAAAGLPELTVSRTPDIWWNEMSEQAQISLTQLRALFAAADVHLSDSELKRLRASGLVPARQVHQAGKRGSTSMYPPWVVDQVELVERLGRSERRFRQLRILVRWHGGWVDPDKLRKSLIEMVEGFSNEVRQLADGAEDELAAVDNVANTMTSKPGRSRALRLLRRRLERQNLHKLAFALAALGLGVGLEWDNADPETGEPSLLSVLERAVGIERARRDSSTGMPPLLTPETSTESILAELQAAGSFDARDTARAFREADDETIEQGFADAHVLASLVPFAQAAQIVYGEDAGGLASLEALIDGDTDALGITLLVRQAILLRYLVSAETWEPLKRSLEEQKPKAIALIEMHRALPEYSDLLSGDSKTKLAALPDTERDLIHDRVRAFFAQRPDLAALNDSPSR